MEAARCGGMLLDSTMEHSERKHYALHVLLGRTVSSFAIDAPHSFQLVFDSGHQLTVYDDKEHYESFSVNLESKASTFRVLARSRS